MKRTVTVGLLLSATVFLTACSGDSPVSKAGASPGSEAQAAASASTNARNSGRTGQTAEAPTLTRKLAKSKAASSYSFQAANSTAQARFDDAAKPVNSLYDSVKVYSALSGGAAKADVAVFTFPAARAKDTRFQGQIVSQLVGQSAGSTRLSYQNLDGHAAAVVRARSGAVGWFSGRKAIIVLARPAVNAQSGVTVASDVAYAYSK